MMKWWGWGAVDKTYSPKKAPSFLAFCVEWLGLVKDNRARPVERSAVKVPEKIVNKPFLDALGQFLQDGQIDDSDDARLLHAYGKSFRDLFRARNGLIESAPDLVLFPESEEQVVKIVDAAGKAQAKLIPFGGGTNIVGAVESPRQRKTTVAAVNLERMNRVLSLDQKSGIAEIEAGALGPCLEEQLNSRGYTLGHFPDSFEFSTLGGWIATRSAGMQSDKYGKIEDMVVSLHAATPIGLLETKTVPKAAVGPDLNQVIIGSEGLFGIITRACMRVHPLKPHEYRGVLFPNFRSGFEAIHSMMRKGIMPVTTRLSNPDETHLGMAIRSSTSWMKLKLEKLFLAYLKKFKGIDPVEGCLMIVGFEGSQDEISEKKKSVYRVIKEFGGVDLGTSVGDKWYAAKYDYPYLRDLLMDYNGVADVTETSATWANALPVYEHTYAVLKRLTRNGDAPGYAGCHLSHSYETGVCLYFTFAKMVVPEKAVETYWEIKRASVDAVLEKGGALSHHHGIGYEHQPWAAGYLGETGMKALAGIKRAFDPDEICNPGKFIREPEFPPPPGSGLYRP